MRALLLGLLLFACVTELAYCQDSTSFYRFVPGTGMRYHLHRRSKISSQGEGGLSYLEISVDADAQIDVDSVLPSGDAVLDVTVGNVNEEKTNRGNWRLSRTILIPRSRVLVSPQGEMLQGLIIQEDSARKNAKELEGKVAFRDIGTVSDQRALLGSLRNFLPAVVSTDSLKDGYTWTDTVRNGKRTSKWEADTRAYGNSQPLVEKITDPVRRDEYLTHSLTLNESWEGRSAWRETVVWTADGKEGWQLFKETGQTTSFFSAEDNRLLGYSQKITCHRDAALLEFSTEVKLTGAR
jgi:hypothetical protein